VDEVKEKQLAQSTKNFIVCEPIAFLASQLTNSASRWPIFWRKRHDDELQQR